MLVRFAVENHLSIRHRQELSMVASPLRDKGADLIDTAHNDLKLLPAAILYGGNASGKSNFLSAINFVTHQVAFSHRGAQPDGRIRRLPFLLDRDSREAPSTFDLEFILNGVRFNYGFSASDNAFVGEWLYAFPSGRKQTWYVRDANRQHVYFGKQLRGASKTIESLMRPNSLFLSVAAQNAHKQLTPIYLFIKNISYNSENAEMATVLAKFTRGEMDRRIISFLERADTGIVDYKFDDYLADAKTRAFMDDIFSLVRKHSPVDFANVELNDVSMKKLSLAHQATDGSHKFLDLAMESRETTRLLVLLKDVFVALDEGSVAVIDELDTSLHTVLAESIIGLFSSNKINTLGAQLIAATHDTSLLSGNYLRRDQIWFVEKSDAGHTEIYPLTDIKTRNTDSIEKGYLQGRFGAIPFRGSLEALVEPR